jgi:hypothetical protein
VDSSSAVFWVKVPYIPASGTKNIYVDYGDASAASASDGNATFDLFDDFSGSSIDAGKWAVQKSANGTNSVSGGRVTFTLPGTTDYSWIHSNSAFSSPVWAEGRMTSFNVSTATLRMGLSTSTNLRSNGNFYPSYAADAYNTYRIVGDNASSGFLVGSSATSDTSSTWSFAWPANSVQKMMVNYADRISGTNSINAWGSSYLYLGAASVRTGTVEVDWVRARKYASPEPTVSVSPVKYLGQWVELCNPTQISYDISGWTLKGGEGTVYTFPASTTLAAGNYIVASVESLGSLDGVSLYDLDGAMRDYVCWGDSALSDANHNLAVSSQNWLAGVAHQVDIANLVVGDTIGRDKDSTDTDCKKDWEITCGKDATGPTPDRKNQGMITQIPIHAGWNLISIPVQPLDTSVTSVFSSISGKWDVVKYYDTRGVSDPWKSFRVGGSSNDLLNIDRTMGVWLRATSSCTLEVQGTVPVSTNINLYAGWNLVGYPSQDPSSASSSLAGTGADIVSVYKAESPYIDDRTDLSGVTLQSGNGYWVHVPADATWVVDW